MARKHIVTCLDCGKQFDANKGGYYIQDKGRYLCKSCGKARKKASKQQNNQRKKPTGTGSVAKIIIGALFVAAGFSSPEGGWTFGYFLTALIIGGGLILWGLLPYLKKHKENKEKASQIAATAECESNRPKRCSSCGATGTGDTCEYCGSKYSS